jgi:hypothetical protein
LKFSVVTLCFQPNIRGKKAQQIEQDLISYTVSAQSGRATAVFSQDGTYAHFLFKFNFHFIFSFTFIAENQVMSDNEQDMPSGVVPLPGPPPR